MKSFLLACLCASWLTACGHDDHPAEGDLVLLDDASDEAFATLADLVSRGEVETNDDLAVALTAPADGATLMAGEPATFEWTPPQTSARHGRATGDFAWSRIDCPGTDEPIDVVAIESQAWTADAERWAKITSATGPCTVTMVSAYIDRGVVTEGPYTPSSTTSFSVAAE